MIQPRFVKMEIYVWFGECKSLSSVLQTARNHVGCELNTTARKNATRFFPPPPTPSLWLKAKYFMQKTGITFGRLFRLPLLAKQCSKLSAPSNLLHRTPKSVSEARSTGEVLCSFLLRHTYCPTGFRLVKVAIRA